MQTVRCVVQDEGELSPETEQEWAQVLLKIKRKDPSIYNAETRLFHESSASKESQSEDEAQDGDDTAAPERKKSKKKVLREILYDQVLHQLLAALNVPQQNLQRTYNVKSYHYLPLSPGYVHTGSCRGRG